VLICFFLFVGSWGHAATKLNLDRLSGEDIARVDSILAKKAPMIREKDRQGTLPLLNFQELYQDLDKKEKKFLDAIRKLKPKDLNVKTPFQGISPEKPKLDKTERRVLDINGKRTIIRPQYLRTEVREAYEKMMEQMKRDIGKDLPVKSAFRSSAYQLYSFIFFLRKHDYSLKKTATLNALPGYSEHGNIKHQALDFISLCGVDANRPAKEFAMLEEYKWLIQHASKYGFSLSYPPGNPYGIAFEPWHWQYVGKTKKD
jgi:LAS superfamily LD-carboxypeptidase LdcB